MKIDITRIDHYTDLSKRLNITVRALYLRQARGVPYKYTKALIEVIKERQKELDEFILLLEKNEK